MHAPDGSCRKPAGARAPETGGTGGRERAHQGPRREWRRRGRRRTPPLGAALAPKGHWSRPHGGARRSRDAAGRRAGHEAATPSPSPSPFGDQRTQGRGNAGDVAGDGQARPIPRQIEHKQPKGGHGGAGTRAGGRCASERWTRGQGSARFRCPMAARATAEMGRAACLKPPPGLSLSKSPFFCESEALVARATIRKRLAFAQARLLCSTGGTVWAG